MGEINNDNKLPEEYQSGGYGSEVLYNLRELSVGGGNYVWYADKHGTRWGSKSFDDAKAWVKNDGTYSFKDVSGNIIIDNDGVKASAIEGGTSIFGWSSTVYFQAVDNNTVNWAAGDIKLSDGTTYHITAGSTGNISSLTYIFLDIDVSTTTLRTTTSGLDATGLNRILVAVCEDAATGKLATYQVFGGEGGLGVMITEDNIAANAVTANVIAANTITASELTTGAFVTSTANISNGVITDAKIADATITNAKIHDLSADKIDAGTLTGRTVKANGGTGTDVWLENSGSLSFRYGGVTKGYIYCTSAGDIMIDADEYIYINSSEGMYISAEDQTLAIEAEDGDMIINAKKDVTLMADDAMHIRYDNDSSGGEDLYIVGSGSTTAKFTSGGDVIFANDVQVDDDLGVVDDLNVGGTKNFQIDHPLKKGYWLKHAAIESNERILLYKGRAKTKNKKAIIKLPNYFEALNKEFDYQLTPIGSLARLAVKTEIKKNKFVVMSDEDCEFSWTVMGIRNDKVAKKNPYKTEVKKSDKPKLELGKQVKEAKIKKRKALTK